MIQQEGTTLTVVAGPGAADLMRKAQPKDSPYHSLLTWDDAEAARLWRLAEAEWWVKAWKESEEHGDGHQNSIL